MRHRWRRTAATVAVLTALLGGLLGFAPKAGASTVLFENWYGCDAREFHYRLIERAIREPNGHEHKNWHVTILHRPSGYTVWANDAFYGDSPYHVYLSTIYGGGGIDDCWFALGTWPGFGFSWTQLWRTWQSGTHQGGVWRCTVSGSGGTIDYGNWTDQHNNIEIATGTQMSESAFVIGKNGV